ncbi:MAG: HEAT repeat domain-containing protein [Deltaproteobacteria bacterium]|nr:HEAT repeat domain-containing protein [Deltaproteobacteria bacterium]
MRKLFANTLAAFSTLSSPLAGSVTLATVSVIALAPAAVAAPAFVYVPRAVDGTETYLPELADGGATTAAGLADQALKKLLAALPDAAAVTVKLDASSAELTIDAAKSGDPAITDRALGAVFHTLRAAGFEEVRLAGKPLSAASFSRGALVGVFPIGAALASKVNGWVDVAGVPIPASAFYKRLDAQDKDVQAAIKALLETGSADVRLLLTTQIDALKSKDKEALLIDRLSDGDARVRKAALVHLAKAPNANVQKALGTLVDKDTDNGVRLDAVKILVASGKKEYERYLLLDKLNAADAGSVIEAAKGLAASKDKKFVPAIAGLAAHTNPAVRKVGVELLRDAGEFGLIAGFLANDQLASDVRELAARTLADQAGVGATEKAAGISWLAQNGPADQALYAAKLARDQIVIGTAQALAKALSRPEADVRKTAAEGLGKLKDPIGLEALAGALRGATDPTEKALYQAQAEAIVSVQAVDQAINIAGAKDATVRELAIRALAAFSKDRPNPKVTEVLKKALAEKEPSIRRAAAYALARTPDEATLADLAKLDADADAEIRVQVAVAIGRAKGAANDAILVKYLDDNDTSVREAALVSIQTKKLAAAFDKVRFLVAHRKVEVRREALRALVLLGKPADPQLFDIYAKAMQDEDTDVKMVALDGLAPYADGRAAQYIGLPLIDDRSPKELKLKTIKVLGGLGIVDAVEHTVRGLFDSDRDIKLATLDALERLKSDKASRPLQEFVLGETDAEVKARANKVLETL